MSSFFRRWVEGSCSVNHGQLYGFSFIFFVWDTNLRRWFELILIRHEPRAMRTRFRQSPSRTGFWPHPLHLPRQAIKWPKIKFFFFFKFTAIHWRPYLYIYLYLSPGMIWHKVILMWGTMLILLRSGSVLFFTSLFHFYWPLYFISSPFHLLYWPFYSLCFAVPSSLPTALFSLSRRSIFFTDRSIHFASLFHLLYRPLYSLCLAVSSSVPIALFSLLR